MNNSNLTSAPRSTRRRRNRIPEYTKTSDDSILLRYKAEGPLLKNLALANYRPYTGGTNRGLREADLPGPSIAKYYGTFKFLPGTKVVWEPTTGSQTAGRVYYCFMDNPEKIQKCIQDFEDYFINPVTQTFDQCISDIKSAGNYNSFPVWMQTEINVPMDTRLKRFDTDVLSNFNNPSEAVAAISRTVQKAFFYAVVGGPVDTDLGNMWYHDRLDCRTLNDTTT